MLSEVFGLEDSSLISTLASRMAAENTDIKTYEDLDNNTNQATDDITEKRTTRKYARDKANAGK